MIYVFPLLIPHSTPATAPQITVCQLSAGTLIRMALQFPGGLIGLAHVGLNVGLHQLYPTNPEGSFASSSETVEWEEEYELSEPPYQLVARAWNDDDTYDHTITVRVVIREPAATKSLFEEIKSLFGG